MRIYVDEIVENIKYTKSSFSKILTSSGISNHFELTFDDLLKLQSLPVKNMHSRSLRFYLDDIIDKHQTCCK